MSSTAIACHARFGRGLTGRREARMKKHLLIGIAVIAVILLGLPFRAGPPPLPAAQPQFTNDGKLVRPEGYRRWVFVSSGFGMSYTQSPSGMQDFTNV